VIVIMKRGEVWWVTFDSSIGGEIRKKRSAVIVSNDISNQFLNRVQVIPLSSKIEKLYPSEAYVTLFGNTSKAMADQITTVSKKRLINYEGCLTSREMNNIDKAISIQLNL
jgi:mRNA interferase MazF